MFILGNHIYLDGLFDNFRFPEYHKSRPYTKGPHVAKLKNKRHKRNKVARQTRKQQRKVKR